MMLMSNDSKPEFNCGTRLTIHTTYEDVKYYMLSHLYYHINVTYAISIRNV